MGSRVTTLQSREKKMLAHSIINLSSGAAVGYLPLLDVSLKRAPPECVESV